MLYFFELNGYKETLRIEEEKDTIPMSLVGSEDACSDNSLISLRAGTPQFDEEQQQICARLRIYVKYRILKRYILPLAFSEIFNESIIRRVRDENRTISIQG